MAINTKQATVSVISWRSLLIFLMILVLMFSMVTPSHAVIAEAAVLVPVVIAALAAFGIGTGVHALQSGNVISWYSQKLEQWANSLGETVNTLLDVAKITADPLGVLRLAPSFLLRVKQFAQWLQQDQNLESGGSSVVIRMGNFSDQPLVYLSDQSASNVVAHGLIAQGDQNSSYQNCFCAKNSSSNIYVAGFGTQSILFVNTTSAGTNGNIVWAIYSGKSSWSPTLTFAETGRTNIGGIDYYWAYINPGNVTSPIWGVPYYNTRADAVSAYAAYNSGQGSSITLTPGAIAYPETTGDDEEDYPYVIDYGGLAGDTVQDAADTIMDKVIDNDLVVEGETDAPPEAIEWPDIMSPPQVQGLDDVFPFCIPFDIYHFLQALSATPVAPRFEIPFYIPNLINYTMVIDLSGFNTAAQVLRTMELLAFCIGLAFVTRKLIRG